MSLYLRLHLLHIALILVSPFADKNALQFTINLISISIKLVECINGEDGEGVIRVCWCSGCHGPSMLLIGPIGLWQADLRHRMGLNIIQIFLIMQSTTNESGEGCFVSASMELSVEFVCMMASVISRSQVYEVLQLKTVIHLCFVFWTVRQRVCARLLCACKKTKHNPSSHLKYKYALKHISAGWFDFTMKNKYSNNVYSCF